MASSGGGAGSSSNPSKSLPLYWAGIPKDLGKPKSTNDYKPKLNDYGLSVVQRLNRTTAAARAKKAADAEARARAAREEEKRKEDLRRAEADEYAKSMMRKSLGGSSKARRPPASGRIAKPMARNIRANNSSVGKAKNGKASRSRRRKRDEDDDEDSYAPMKGMERIERKKRAKAPEIRNTSDYSDLFGDNYLVGAEVEATKALARTSKAETELVRARDEQEKAERRRKIEMSEKFDAVKKRMEKDGELKTKAGKQKLVRLRKQLQALEYDSLDGSVAAGSSASNAQNNRPMTKKAQQEMILMENAAKKAAIKARLAAMNSEPEPPRVESRVERKRNPEPVRPLRRKRSFEDDEYESEVEHRRSALPTKRRRRPSYISESEEDDDEDDSGSDRGGFETSFADIEEEERISAAYGRHEDKKERQAELRRKREKAIRLGRSL